MSSESRIHLTADISPAAVIGQGTRIWHHVHVREGARIGADCVIGKDVYIDKDVVIGNRVKIQNGVSVYHGVTLEDDVFVGPHAAFTNDLYPRAFSNDWQVTPTLVRRGASVGANATIVCGVVIGEYAMVGAGAVVTRSVPAETLVIGNPARVVRRIGRDGRPLMPMLPIVSGSTAETAPAVVAPSIPVVEPVMEPASGKGPVPVMLIGFGAMGANHARVITALPNSLKLVAIADPDSGRRDAASAKYPGVAVIADYQLGLPLAKAVIIAAPTPCHDDITGECLRAGKHCLVEKPLAATAASAAALAELASARGLVLAVGHVERYNPAVEALGELLSGQRIVAVSAERLSPNPGRSLNIDVVHDLMIHDLEVVDALLADEAISIQASGAGPAEQADYASAVLRYRGGAVVTLTASRITENRIRRLRVTTDTACYDLDYVARTISVSRRAANAYTAENGRLGLVQSYTNEVLTLNSSEPLVREMLDFATAVSTGMRPRVDGADGARAVALAERVCERVARDRAGE